MISLFPASLLLAAAPPIAAVVAEGAPRVAVVLVDVAEEAGVTLLNLGGGAPKRYLLESTGNGAAFTDFDGDGDQDLLLVNGSTVARLEAGGDLMAALYRNEGGWRFLDVTPEAGLGRRGWGAGVCVADVDADGFEDLYLTAYGPNVLYRNLGDGTFRDVASAAGVADGGWGTSCAFGDVDRDGDVDLYVANYVEFDLATVSPKGRGHPCNYLGRVTFCGPRPLPAQADLFYRNRGDGTFEDATEAAGLAARARYGLGVAFADLVRDGWPDLFVANDSQPNYLFRNRGEGTFVEEGMLAGVAVAGEAREQAAMGVAVGDPDGDGDLDLFITNFSQDYNTLYRNDGEGLFADATFLARLGGSSMPYLAWGTGFVDLDNDGRQDLFVANGHIYDDVGDFEIGSTYEEANQVYLNLGDGRFEEQAEDPGGGLSVLASSRGAAFGDVDNDGDRDIVVVNLDARPTLLRNDTESPHAWLTLRLVATRSSPEALGSRVTLLSGGRRQAAEVQSGGSYQSQHDLRLHWGLGRAAQAEVVEIAWVDGSRRRLHRLPANHFLVVTQ